MATTVERLTVLETELKMVKAQNEKDHADIKVEICGIKDDIKEYSAKVDQAMTNKADKAEVIELGKKYNELDKSMAVLIVKVGAIVAILTFILELVARKYFK